MKIRSVRDTGRLMREVVNRHYRDVAAYATLSLPEIFDLVKSIPYRRDPKKPNGKVTELLQRPAYTLARTGHGGDCDDKAMVLASWAKLNGIPFRFVAVGRAKNLPLHHVLVELYIQGNWVHVDPTYAGNVLGRPLAVYGRKEVIG